MISSGDGVNVVRYDTKANWDKYNPILEKGEIAVEVASQGKLMKCGDGVTEWSNLKYIFPSNVYTSFPQLGLSKDTVTIESIIEALPSHSKLMVYASPYSTSNDYAPLLGLPINGLLVVEKHANNNVPVVFQLFALSNNYNVYNAMYSDSISTKFSGWGINDRIVEQKILSSPNGNTCSYEVYSSGKVVMYGYDAVAANASYVDITPPITLSKVLLVIPSDAIWATRTAIASSRTMQWNIGSDTTGLINGKIRIVMGETRTGADSICYYAIGFK